MIVHTVICRLSRPVDASARSSFLEQLSAFAATAPLALEPVLVKADLDLRPEGRSVSEAIMQAKFAGPDEFAAYLAHPDHVALVQNVLTPNLEAWLSVQYEAMILA